MSKRQFRRLVVPDGVKCDDVTRAASGQLMQLGTDGLCRVLDRITLWSLAGTKWEGQAFTVPEEWVEPVTDAEALVAQRLFDTFWDRDDYPEGEVVA